MAVDLVANMIAHAQGMRRQREVNITRVAGFTYHVEGTQVVRRGPNGVFATVWSRTEIEDSLNPYQLALLLQNRQRASASRRPALKSV